MTTILVALLAPSLFANAVLLAWYFKKAPSPKKQVTYDVQALLRDLATGPALLKLEYLDRADVLLRSPRERQ